MVALLWEQRCHQALASEVAMKIKPSRILLIVCGGGILVAILLGILGAVLKSSVLERAGVIAFLVAAVISCLPLVLGGCYLGWDRMHKRLRQNAEIEGKSK